VNDASEVYIAAIVVTASNATSFGESHEANGFHEGNRPSQLQMTLVSVVGQTTEWND
jgi:hypothetical protein